MFSEKSAKNPPCLAKKAQGGKYFRLTDSLKILEKAG
jgi:hypothetical protein